MIIKPFLTREMLLNFVLNFIDRIYEQCWYDVRLVIRNVSVATTSYFIAYLVFHNHLLKVI